MSPPDPSQGFQQAAALFLSTNLIRSWPRALSPQIKNIGPAFNLEVGLLLSVSCVKYHNGNYSQSIELCLL